MAAFKVLLALIGTLILAQLTDWPLLDEIAVALGLLLAVAFLWSRFSLRGVGFERAIMSDRCQVGHNAVDQLVITNRRRLPKLWLEARDFSTLPGHRASRVVNVGGRGRGQWRVETVCQKRGKFRMGPVLIRSGDPFGLFTTKLQISETHELVVYPAIVSLDQLPMPPGQLAGGAPQNRHSPTVTTSVAGLREYVSGDALNRISWTASARIGRLMVKEFDHDPSADVWIVVDLDRSVHIAAGYPDDRPGWRPPPAPWLSSTEEYAITTAASLARRLLDLGRSVGLIASGDHHTVIYPDRGDRQMIRILETLAVVNADGQTSLAEVLTGEGRRLSGQAAVMTITPSTDERWVEALAELSNRRVRASAVVIEADTFAPTQSALLIISGLLTVGVPTSVIKCGDDIALALAEQSSPVSAPARLVVSGGS